MNAEDNEVTEQSNHSKEGNSSHKDESDILAERAHKERIELFVFCLVLFVFGVAGKYVNPWLQFDRSTIVDGQIWRLFTCAWVHLSVTHMLLNLAGLVLATLVFKPYVNAKLWYTNLFACCLSVGLGILIFDANIQQYVGLSGALYGVMALGAILSLKQQPLIGGVMLVYISYRVYEQNRADFDIASMYDFIGGNVVASSHLFGIITGTVIALVVLAYKYQRFLSKQ